MDLDDLEKEYVSVYIDLLVEMDRLFLLQNGTDMDKNLESKSRLRAMHQLNVAETATVLNLDPANTSRKHIERLLEQKFVRDGEIHDTVGLQWDLIQEWLELAQETNLLRSKLVELTKNIPKKSLPAGKLTTASEDILDSLYTVLLVQGGYQDQELDTLQPQ